MKKHRLILIAALLILILCITACAKAPNPDVALVEFPGLKWNDTSEQVIEKLKLTEDQILENAMQIPAEDAAKTEYDVWNLTITDWTFLHSKVVGGQFTFVRYPGCAFGLMRVQLYLADDTDMNALRAEMKKEYGEVSTDPRPAYTIWDGKIEASESGIKRRDDGFPHYWYASVTGTEVLSAQAVERYVEYMASSDVPADRMVAVEYLNKVPVAEISCSTWNLMAAPQEDSEKESPYVTHNTVIYSVNQMVQLLQRFE